MVPLPRANPSEQDDSASDLRVVAIGGGTGLSTLLKGLKRFVLTPALAATGNPCIRELCGVVTVSDDGGSSGRLRKEFNMLPPGDVRNCIVALSRRRGSTLATLSASLSKGRRPRRPQLRQSLPRRAHLHHRRLRRSGPPVFRNSSHARPHFSRDHFLRRT